MKKTITMVIVLALCLALLCGCGKKEEPAQAPVAGLANPVKSYTSADEQLAATGIALAAPEGAEDIAYQSINDMSETRFTLDGVKYCYRAQPTAETASYDMSGLYYTWTETVDGTVAGREAKASIGSEAGFVRWLDVVPGINYNLSAEGAVSAELLFATAELVFVPVQGNAG